MIVDPRDGRIVVSDVLAAIDAARLRPEAQLLAFSGMKLADCGKSARDDIAAGATRNALMYLREASAVELEHQVEGGWKYAHQILQRLIDEVVTSRACTECGSALGRPCTVKVASGGVLQREWIHELRLQAAMEVLA